MAERWQDLPLDQPLFRNVDDDAVIGFQLGIENGYTTELGGHSRFPGMVPFAELADEGRVYLHDWNQNLIAVTSRGRIYSIDRQGNVRDRTGALVAGGRRVIFAKTDREITMAAGGSIVRLRSAESELLSKDAPQASHVAFVDRFLLAAEINSGRFFHSKAGLYDEWDPLDTFAADGDPDNINALMVTPFREVMVTGRNSIEQFEPSQSGAVPFFRRWSVGEGVAAPYCMLFADNAMWVVNKLFEFARASGQVAVSESGPIQRLLESVDDWSDAWIGGFPDKPLHILGQKFILLQIPNATNPYGEKGITLLFDYRNRRWSELYGWSTENGVATRWPGWSHWSLWGRTFVGGEGRVYELREDNYDIAGERQRWLVRTGHMATNTEVMVKALRLRIKRGEGGNGQTPSIAVRCRRDQREFGPWIRRSLGRPGQRTPIIEFGGFGIAHTFQFEISCEDNAAVELMNAQIHTEDVGA